MADYGHKWTDKRLEIMEKRIARIYSETVDDAKKRLGEILKTFEKEDKEKAALVEAGKMKRRNYIAWRQETLGKAKHLKDMIGVLSEDFTNADKIAMRIVSGEALDVYALNANFAAYDIEQNMKMNLSWTLYDRSTVERLIKDTPDLLPLPSVDIPVDMQWNRQHITEAITKGILLGDPIPEIAQRLQGVANMGYHAAVRSARTATTAAECAGRTDTYKRAEKMGIQLKQQWVATLDGRTRHEHRQADGQMVDIGKPFVVDGYEMDYPGDPKAPGYLIYNCRCTVISVDKFHDPNAPRASKLGGVSYEEWKSGREVADGNRWGTTNDAPQIPKKTVDIPESNSKIKAEKPMQYKQFETGEGANNFFYYDSEERGLKARKNSEHGKWMNGLSRDERDCIGDYTGGGYYDINSYLRKTGDWKNINPEKEKFLVRNIDSAIAKYKLKDNIRVQRGVMTDVVEKLVEENNVQNSLSELIGKKYIEKGYSSTTVLRDNMVATVKPVVFDIEIPAGVGRGAYINQLAGQYQDAEYEFLIKRGASFTISDVVEEENMGEYRYYIKLVMNDE